MRRKNAVWDVSKAKVPEPTSLPVEALNIALRISQARFRVGPLVHRLRQRGNKMQMMRHYHGDFDDCNAIVSILWPRYRHRPKLDRVSAAKPVVGPWPELFVLVWNVMGEPTTRSADSQVEGTDRHQAFGSGPSRKEEGGKHARSSTLLETSGRGFQARVARFRR